MSAGEHQAAFGPYRLIGVDLEENPRPDLIILDTNVAIDIEKFYFGTGRVDVDALGHVLRAYPRRRYGRFVDLNYGWASSECAWTRGGDFRAAQSRRLRWALARVVDWDPTEMDRALANRRPPVDRDRAWKKGPPVLDPSEVPRPLPQVLLSYTALLYLCHLDRTRQAWRGRGNLWALQEYHRWMSEDLGLRLAYELVAAADMFFGTQDRRNAVRRLLKLGGRETPDQIADQAWNAAWDVTFVRMTEGMSLGLLPLDRAKATCVLSRDLDPWLVRTASQVRMVIDGGEARLPYLMSQWGELGDDVHAQIMQMLQSDPLEDYWRSRRDPQQLTDQLVRVLRELEQAMGITIPTAASSLTPP